MITSAANTNLRAITYHFESKEQFIAEALTGAVRRLVEPALVALRREEDDPIPRMLQAVAELRQGLDESPEPVAGYLQVVVESCRIPALVDSVCEPWDCRIVCIWGR